MPMPSAASAPSAPAESTRARRTVRNDLSAAML